MSSPAMSTPVKPVNSAADVDLQFQSTRLSLRVQAEVESTPEVEQPDDAILANDVTVADDAEDKEQLDADDDKELDQLTASDQQQDHENEANTLVADVDNNPGMENIIFDVQHITQRLWHSVIIITCVYFKKEDKHEHAKVQTNTNRHMNYEADTSTKLKTTLVFSYSELTQISSPRKSSETNTLVKKSWSYLTNVVGIILLYSRPLMVFVVWLACTSTSFFLIVLCISYEHFYVIESSLGTTA